MVARDQFIGPYQVPVSDYSMSLRSFTSNSGEVLTIGEKPTLAINNPAASMRMAMAEALCNMSGVHINGLDEVQVSANWMAATGEEVEDLSLREGVEALSKCCVDLKVSVPVGKDSLSMRTKWDDDSVEHTVKSPLSGVITAMAPVKDVTCSVTPELNTEKDSKIIYVQLNNNKRLAGSIFSEVTQSSYMETPDVDDMNAFKEMFNSVQELVSQNKILALHDVSVLLNLVEEVHQALAAVRGGGNDPRRLLHVNRLDRSRGVAVETGTNVFVISLLGHGQD
jgi:phosphoribosylformylglycinamidine synthase